MRGGAIQSKKGGRAELGLELQLGLALLAAAGPGGGLLLPQALAFVGNVDGDELFNQVQPDEGTKNVARQHQRQAECLLLRGEFRERWRGQGDCEMRK